MIKQGVVLVQFLAVLNLLSFWTNTKKLDFNEIMYYK